MTKKHDGPSQVKRCARNTHGKKLKLKANDKGFKDLVLSVGDWIWEVDENGRYTYCSDTVTPILGYTPEEIIGKSPFDFMPEEEAERIRESFMGFVEKRAPFKDLENWNLTKAGEPVCLLTNGFPVFDGTGKFRGYRGVDKDITALKTAKQNLTDLYRCFSNLGVNFEDNIQSLVETTGKVLGAHCTYYYHLENGALSLVSTWNPVADFVTGSEIDPEADNVFSETLKQSDKGALIISHLRNSRFALLESVFKRYELDAYLGQPVYVKGVPQGVLCAFFKKDKLPENAMDLMGTIAGVIGKEEERHLASQKLEARESFLHALVESAIDAIAVIDFHRCFVDVNQAFCDMFGYEKEAVLGKPTKIIHISEEESEKFGNTIYPVIREKGYWRGEGQFKRRDGTIFPIESITTEFRDEMGKVFGYVAFIRDISERKKAEEALRKAHERLAQIIDAIHSILIGVSSDGTVFLWNKVAEETFGLTGEEMVGKLLDVKKIPWEWERIKKGIQTCSREKEIINVEDVRFTDRRGGEGFLGVTINRVVDAQGDLTGTLIFAADISKRKLMESQLLQAQKMESIGQLAAGIAHEINTPTQFVGDNLNFLKDAFGDLLQLLEKFDELVTLVKSENLFPEALREIERVSEEIDLAFIREEILKAVCQSMEGIERVSHIVRAMKEFSHPGVKEKEWVDLNKAIKTTITVTKNAWKYVAELKTRLDPTLDPVLCSPDEINQVILNLIVNSAQAIEEAVGKNPEKKGRIVIETHDMGKWAEIRVRDTGPGIPEKIQNRIFDPFFTTKEVGKGTGQGLAIAYDFVVHKHRGELTFETREGEGTVFIVKLPKKVEGSVE